MGERTEYYRKYYKEHQEEERERHRQFIRDHPGYMQNYRKIHPEFVKAEKEKDKIRYRNNLDRYKNYRNKRFRFKGKFISINEVVRTGYCSWCPKNIHDGTCKKTHIHHIKYHDEDPLKDTVEICISCHQKETWRIRRLVIT